MEIEPGTPVRRLTAAQLAYESSASPELVDELVRAGAIHPAPDGTHGADDIPRVRLAQALTTGGISVDDLMHEIRTGQMPFDQVSRMGFVPEASGRTVGEFTLSLGDHGARLPAIYAAFGLGLPPPETAMRPDEQEALLAFFELWTMVDGGGGGALRHARIVGEGMRHIVAASLDLFDELGGSPPPRLHRGMSIEDAVRPSVQMPATMNLVLTWLRERHTEHDVFDRIVAYTEGSLAGAGRMPIRPVDPPAIAFVDLTGYTERTAKGGDVLAVRDATTLQGLAQTAAAAHAGRVVKLLGDGVMLRFVSAVDAVVAVRELTAAIAAGDLPLAHAGIAVGPVIDRDGDVYGHTVNLAARIASVSEAGELLVTWEVTDALTAAGISFSEASTANLKGVAEPVRLARVKV